MRDGHGGEDNLAVFANRDPGVDDLSEEKERAYIGGEGEFGFKEKGIMKH